MTQDKEGVMQCQYDHQISYFMSKYRITRNEATDMTARRYIISKDTYMKWELADEDLKLGKIISELNR